ncbi:uncharacterized protein [Physcomitrium patens]|uniref:PX domain-containing protein n=1 Tax=Physcomitrium patens TaxID=3218 RepID=A9S4X5_PHYPA|nr:uncharacterized protein LOC112291449 isoform X2 [Physcomitrium patens]PNR41216.1 hypothetical protein PHYPA_018619 [Physcomitrium patens]|eukprot:XP_024394619.1 uncharacterized protein LOC112291449 isoform X2 [Physcomitrella patens]
MEIWTALMVEARRRIIVVAVVAISLVYMMSLTSNSVWINLPMTTLFLAALHHISFDIEIRWKPPPTQFSVAPPQLHRRQLSCHNPLLSEAFHATVNKFDSASVEAAVNELTRSLVDEWVTNLWYSSVTPDEEAPEELRIFMNGMIGEVAQRVKRVNLITLLSQNLVDLVGSQLELYRRMKAKIGPDIICSLSTEERDEKLKHAMLSSRELHPALVSTEAEYKVLKRLTGGIVALVLKRQDAQCRLLRIMARELLVCVVLRPILNLASPEFINEIIENQALASTERARRAAEEAAEAAKQRLPDRILQRKPSVSGLEMTSLGKSESTGRGLEIVPYQKSNESFPVSVDSIGTSFTAQQSVESESFEETLPDDVGEWGPIPRRDWAQVLDAVTQRRAQALTPEHLDNLWTKGRNYKQRESEKVAALASTTQNKKDNAGICTLTAPSTKVPTPSTACKGSPENSGREDMVATSFSLLSKSLPSKKERSSAIEQYRELLFGDSKDGDKGIPGIGFSPAKTACRSSEVPDGSSAAKLRVSRKGLDFAKCCSDEGSLLFSRNDEPMSENNRHEPNARKKLAKSASGPLNLQWSPRHLSFRKSKSMDGERHGWEETEGGPKDELLTPLDAEGGPLSRGTIITDRIQESSVEEFLHQCPRPQTPSLATESTSQMFLKCRALGAHFQKSGSKAFAVYTIEVADAYNRSWRVQRRYRNFEQLHKRLKYVSSYSLRLPPKRFLSSNLDTIFVRERCLLLDKYLKDLLAMPSVAGLRDVWDFFSINSQHYAPGVSPSMMKTLAVNIDGVKDDLFRQIRGISDDISEALKLATSGIRQRLPLGSGDLCQNVTTNSTHLKTTLSSESMETLFVPGIDFGGKMLSNSALGEEYERNYGTNPKNSAEGVASVEWHSESEVSGDFFEANISKTAAHAFGSQLDLRYNRWIGRRLESAPSDGHSPVDSIASDVIGDEFEIPNEWSPPKVTVPILNLVDQIFQLQGRGWIRRQVLWIAKQILQIGMGDAFDDWLIARLQWLRKEEVVASGIHWLKGVLWPDGIFITKHPKNSTIVEDSARGFSDDSREGQQHPPLNSFEQRQEAARRAEVVREIILDKAPATLVSIIGKKQYTSCANDIYYFSQASVCMKQLAYNLLETALLATFPELHDLVLDVRSTVILRS